MGSAQLKSSVSIDSLMPAVPIAGRSSSQFQTVISILERLADFISVIVAIVLANVIYRSLELGKHFYYSNAAASAIGIAFSILFVVMLDQQGAYRRTNSLLRIRETERILRVCTRMFALAFAFTFFFSYSVSRWTVVIAAILVTLIMVVEKQLMFLMIRQLHSRGYGLRNVLIYGAGFTGRRVFSALVSSPKVGLNPVAIVDDNRELTGKEVFVYGYKRDRSAPVISGPISQELIRQWNVQLIVVGIPSLSIQRLNEIAVTALAAGASLSFVPQLSFDTELSTEHVDLDGLLIASLDQVERKWIYEIAKRSFDLLAAMFLLLATMPVWAFIYAAVKWDSKGPAFFTQTRVGRGGKLFKLFKFRSMRTDAPKFGFHPTEVKDPRITRVGRWLRRTSLDELPQLINVLKGDMSLVGPRPEMPFIVEGYNSRHWQRLNAMPGLTGLWQLSADRAFLIHENIQYDLYYIRNRNFFMDLAILLHTAIFAMKGV